MSNTSENSITQDASIRLLTVTVNGYEPYAGRAPILRQAIIDLQPDLLSFQEAAYRPGIQHQIAECLDGLGYQIDHQFDGIDDPSGCTGKTSAKDHKSPTGKLMVLPYSTEHHQPDR